MDTRLRTRMRAGGSRPHYQQFDYSTSDPERERSDDLLSDELDPSGAELPALVDTSRPPDEQPMSHEPSINDQLPLFSESKVIPDAAQTQAEAEESLAGTSICSAFNQSFIDESASQCSPIAG